MTLREVERERERERERKITVEEEPWLLSDTQSSLSLTKIFSNLEMDQENDFEEIWEPSPDCCIYRVPQYLRKINEGAYTPELISIGPLHYGRKELMGMGNQKRRYWSKFGQRINEEKLKELKTYIEKQEQYIRDHYSVTSMLQSSTYVAMILYDAVFIIELFLRKYQETEDFLLKRPLSVVIQKDLMLLENQLPYFVLNDLYTKAFPNERQSLSILFLNYLFGKLNWTFLAAQYPQSKHFVDFYRFIFLENKPSTVEQIEVETYDLPCATRLSKSGLKFIAKKGKSGFDLGISLEKRKQYGEWFPWFEVNELKIPTIQIYDNTEFWLRNLMVFEMFHYPTKTHICHYAALMDHLIDTGKDVDLLVEKGIIVNHMGDNEALAKMFNTLLSRMVLSEHSCYNDIAKKMKEHYMYPWNHVKATLKSAYFSDLWTGTATVGATSLLILTLIQSVCSILQVNQGTP